MTLSQLQFLVLFFALQLLELILLLTTADATNQLKKEICFFALHSSKPQRERSHYSLRPTNHIQISSPAEPNWGTLLHVKIVPGKGPSVGRAMRLLRVRNYPRG